MKIKIFIVILSLFFFLPYYSKANELDKTSACAGVVMGDGATNLREFNDENSFNDAFKIAMNAYYGQGFSQSYSDEDLQLSEQIMSSNIDKIYLAAEWTADVYEEVLRCYRMLGLKILENSEYIEDGSKTIKKYEEIYRNRVKRLIEAG